MRRSRISAGLNDFSLMILFLKVLNGARRFFSEFSEDGFVSRKLESIEIEFGLLNMEFVESRLWELWFRVVRASL